MIAIRAKRAALALLACAVTACSSSATQLVVVVDSDIPALELESVVVVSRDPRTGAEIDRAERDVVAASPSPGEVTLPFSFAVRPQGDPGEVELVVTGELAEAPDVERVVRTRFLRDHVALVRVHLSRACAPSPCTGGLACERGTCVDPAIEPEPIDGWPPGVELDAGVQHPMDGGDGGTEDAGDDGGTDAGADGGVRELACTTDGPRPVGSDLGDDFDVAFDGTRIGILRATSTGLTLAIETGPTAEVVAIPGVIHPALAWRGIGWVGAFEGPPAGQIGAFTAGPDGGDPAVAGTLAASARPPTLAGDADQVILGFVTPTGADPTALLYKSASWGSPTALEAAYVNGSLTVASAGRSAAAAWGDDAQMRVVMLDLSGVAPIVAPGRYATPGPAFLATVDVALSGSDIVIAGWSDSSASVRFARWLIGTETPRAVVDVQPGGAPVVGPASIALRSDGSAAMVFWSESSPRRDLWLAVVDRRGELGIQLLRQSSLAATRAWVFAGSDHWVVAYSESTGVDAIDVYCGD